MSNLLVRGVSDDFKNELAEIALEENLSKNQALVYLLNKAMKIRRREKEEAVEYHEVFARARELRRRIRSQYGKFGDSTQLLREDRDSH